MTHESHYGSEIQERMMERCQAKVGWNKQCPNTGEKYETRPRTDAIVLRTWACPEHAAVLPSWKWKHPNEWDPLAYTPEAD